MQQIRIYFDRKDEKGNIIHCLYDAIETDEGEIVLGELWGEMLEQTEKKIGDQIVMTNGRLAKSDFILKIIMEKLPHTKFERFPYNGNFNQYPPIKTETK